MNLPADSSVSYIGAFFAGVVVSFSPCVYPLVPVTLSFIGVKGATSRLKGLLLSLVYVFGMAVTYSILGLIASLTGRLFGQVAANPISYLIIGNICIIAGLSFFDVFNINFTGIRLQNKVKKTGGFFDIFLFGLVSGLIAGPCTAPALGVILAIVASRQNAFYGVTLLFVFAYGMGVVLILAGAFGSLIFNLAKSGVWLERIKKLGGIILIAIGEYFILQAGRLM